MLQPQLSNAHADGAGGNQHDLIPCIFEIADDLTEAFHLANVQMPGGVGQGRGSNLDTDSHNYDVPAFWMSFLHYGIKSRKCQSL